MPKTKISNTDSRFSTLPDLPKHWFRFWGVETRGFFDENLGENELNAGCKASSRVIAKANLKCEDIDVILASSSYTYMHGGTECKTLPVKRYAPRLSEALKKELGLLNAKCIDQQADCLSFLVGMQIASGLIRQGLAKNVLVCSSEFISPGLDLTRKEGTIFGDGCGAAILSRSQADGDLIGSYIKSSAENYMVATAQWRAASDSAKVEGGDNVKPYFTLKNDGQETMKKFIPFVVPNVVNKLYQKFNISADDIDFFIFHQPSKTLVDAWAQGSCAHPDQYIYTMKDQGVMVSASIPYTLYTAIKEGKIKGNEKVIIAGAATGWTFGCQLWQLENTQVC
jgi:putative alkyl quinolone biosynthesis protein PqsC